MVWTCVIKKEEKIQVCSPDGKVLYKGEDVKGDGGMALRRHCIIEVLLMSKILSMVVKVVRVTAT